MRRNTAFLLILLSVMLMVSCSTKKNTAMTRRVQAFKARYNTYFNAHQAYLEGIEAQRTGNKDNYTELIPLFMTGNKNTVSLGKSNFDKAVEKCQKTIRRHSITARPEVNRNKKKTQKEKIWLSQKEYNPFLYKAWFLLGEAQFHKGEYMEAASTFAYIQRIYFSKPNIIARARIMEAKCYAELKWYFDAENLLTTAARDSIPEKWLPVRDAVLADCMIGDKQYREAIPLLRNAIKKAQGNYQKARMYFLLGQLYHAVGENAEAYKAFKKVPGKNPPYDLAFNARIKMTEVMSETDSKQMIRKLKSMAKNPKNKDYLDQVYYAIGNIYLANKDTLHAMWAYNDGVEKSTRNGVEKGVVWLHLGQLYWEKEKFVKAKDCYAGALGLFDKEREDYKDIDERTKILEELYQHAAAVELQDSLQNLARMDSVKRMEVIHKMIEEVKKKEKEEAKKAAEANRPNNAGANMAGRNGAINAGANRGNQRGGVWYFYNPQAVESGRQEFQKKWGQRELADDWRRSNKTVLANDDQEEESDEGEDGEGGEDGESDGNAESPDAQAQEGAENADGSAVKTDEPELSEKEMEEKKKQEEYANDPHRPEYYLKDIPFTDEQMEASNAALVEGLYNSAVIYKDRMENFPLAERTFNRVLNDFPEFERKDELYYNMFQLYSRQGKELEASDFKDRLISEYPDNAHVKTISDPRFEYKARYGMQIEDSLYQNAYENFKANQFSDVVTTSQYALEEYPDGANRARFMFLEAMSQLELGNRNKFLTLMKSIVEKYPKSTVSELAGLYVKGVKEGRILASGKMEMGSVWDRRAMFLIDGDSALTDTAFTAKRDDIHIFVVAYEHNSLNENQLLYEIARYNFMNFPVRNFDINIEIGDGVDMLQVRPFLNFNEAYLYLKKMQEDEEMAYKMEGLKCFIISDHDLKLVNRGLSFTDYFEFFDATYQEDSIPQIDENLLFEPANIPTPEQQAEEKKEEKKEEQKEGDDVEIGDFDDFDDEPAKNQQLEERGEFFDDFDTNNNQQEDNRQNQQLEERGEFFDDFDINNNQQEDNRQNQQEEDRGEYLDDIDADTKTEPVKTEPVKTEPVKTEPVKTEPVKTEPVKTEPVKTEPVKTEPVKTEPVKTEPVKTEPVKTEEQTQPVKQEEWDGNVEDFDDEPVQQQEEETEEWDGNVEDFDVDPKNGVIDNSGETDDWDDEDDEDYIF